MALRAKSATGGLRLTDSAVIWRAEVFRDDGRWSRAEWFGRADYPDRDAARIWLASRLENLRDSHRPPECGVLWGELTAGRLGPALPDSATALSSWRPIEEWGATATAFLWNPRDPIKWDADEWFSWANPAPVAPAGVGRVQPGR